jgi:threonine dehydrogenase-like Zn-dependent dehydrogenase
MGLEVWAVEVVAPRREKAEAMGAVAAVDRLAPDAKFDYVLDASGAPQAVADGLRRLRKRGIFTQMGVTPRSATATFAPYELYENEWSFIGSNSVADCYERAAEHIVSIAGQMRQLITHTLPLADVWRAAQLMGDPSSLKIQVDPRT